MMMKSIAWALTAVVAGWMGGQILRKTTEPGDRPEGAGTVATVKDPASSRAPEPADLGWGIRDDIGLEELRGSPPGARRRAEALLWLNSAGSGKLGAWWPELLDEEPNDGVLLDLVMTRWMAVDPLGALEVVGGGPEEYRAWWAWGKVDAEAAVAECRKRNAAYLWRIMQGAGGANPRLAMRLAEENPALAFPAVMHAIKQGLQDEDWQEAVEFAFDGSTLARWAKYEPAKALGWALENHRRVEDRHWNDLLTELDERDPEALRQALEELPPGKLQRDLLLARVRMVAARDPEAALRIAAGAPGDSLRHQLQVAVGLGLAVSDPKRSMELFREAAQGGMGRQPTPLLPGRTAPGKWMGEESEWLRALVRHDPETVMEIAAETDGASLTGQATGLWVRNDAKAFGDWVATRPSGQEKDAMLDGAIRRFRFRAYRDGTANDLALTVDWARSLSEPAGRGRTVRSVVGDWIRHQPEVAEAFFSPGGPASEAQRAVYDDVKGGQP